MFRALVDQSNDFIEVIDLKTARILDVNQSSCIAHQYTREELLQLSIPDLDPWVNEKGWEKVTEEFIKNKTKILRTFHRRKDGSLFPVEVNANILRLDRDYMLAVVRDVTNIMRLEEQIAKSQKMEAVGRLAGGVAHDFNNLLTVINCHVDILLMQAGDQDARREHYDAIRHAGHRAAELTAQLLAFSRKSRVEPVYLDLNRVVESAQRLFSRAIREDIRLELCLANDLPLVNANPGQLEQVLMNLVVNAMDAMPGSGSITVTTRQVNVPPQDVNAEFELPEGDYVVLEISDTGHGFDIALKDKIFEPFFTTKEVGKGTGLGLAVVHGVMMQCGGRVEVDSQVGVGSTFHLIFPAVNGANPSMVLSTDNQACHGSETILLVEDEAAVRRIVYDVLKGQGYELLIAQNGAEALSVLDRRGEAVQLVLTDVVMPEMGGVELAKRIQQRYPQTHVLFMSGYMAEPSNDNELSKYGDGFIAKPFSPVDLVRKVRSVLDAAHVAPSGAGA